MDADSIADELRSLSNRLQTIAGSIDEAVPLIETHGNCRQSQVVMRGLTGELREAFQISKGLSGMLFLVRRK